MFYNSENNLFYEVEFTDPSQFPTRAEVAMSIPSPRGSGTGMEDCCLNGSWILDGLLSAHRVTGDKEWADKARKVFQGLVSLGAAGRTKGFVARGFAPGRRDIYPNSSTDQFAGFIYAMWAYAKSRVCSADERKTATELVVNVARLVESFHDDIPTDNMEPSIYGDTSAMKPDRACRLLQFYKAAYDLSGDKRWQDVYMDRVEHNNRARLDCYYGSPHVDPMFLTHAVYGYFQSQAAQRLLYETEGDPEIRDAYRRAMSATAAVHMPKIDLWRERIAAPPRHVIPGEWKLYWGAFVKEQPIWGLPQAFLSEEGLRRDVGLGAFRQFVKENRERILAEASRYGKPELLTRAVTRLPSLQVPVEVVAIAMLSEDIELKREAARKGWEILSSVDFSRAGSCNDLCCVAGAYWRGAEAGLFPLE
jgi:hypothetical protein